MSCRQTCRPKCCECWKPNTSEDLARSSEKKIIVVVAATNRNLAAEIDKKAVPGRFGTHRFPYTLQLPRCAKGKKTFFLSVRRCSLSSLLMQSCVQRYGAVVCYPFRSNVRELRNAVKKRVIVWNRG